MKQVFNPQCPIFPSVQSWKKSGAQNYKSSAQKVFELEQNYCVTANESWVAPSS